MTTTERSVFRLARPGAALLAILLSGAVPPAALAQQQGEQERESQQQGPQQQASEDQESPAQATPPLPEDASSADASAEADGSDADAAGTSETASDAEADDGGSGEEASQQGPQQSESEASSASSGAPEGTDAASAEEAADAEGEPMPAGEAPPLPLAAPDLPDDFQSSEAIETAERGPSVPDEPSEEEFRRCTAQLDELDVIYTVSEPVAGEGECGVRYPVDLSSIGPIIMNGGSRLTCDTALGIARWVERIVVPAAESLGDDVELTHLDHGASYVCRTRNRDPDEQLSWHGFGRAMDITGFRFDGHDPIPIRPRTDDGTIEEAFQRTVRAGACLFFTTVLGPGADDYHDDHLHLDTAIRSNDYRLCQ